MTHDNELTEWQPAILLPIDKVNCKLHRRILEELPSDASQSRSERVGTPVKIRLGSGVKESHGSNRLPNGDCYPVQIKDKDGLIAGAFSCEFATD